MEEYTVMCWKTTMRGDTVYLVINRLYYTHIKIHEIYVVNQNLLHLHESKMKTRFG